MPTSTHTADTANPLLQPWDTPYGLPPFGQMQARHFTPAFEQALTQHRAEIDAIATQAEHPNFDNTLAALDQSGRDPQVQPMLHKRGLMTGATV